MNGRSIVLPEKRWRNSRTSILYQNRIDRGDNKLVRRAFVPGPKKQLLSPRSMTFIYPTSSQLASAPSSQHRK